ncbi:hypothetical protein Zm00014a_021069 [Zea mays]|jgi:hypothetical protein|uniref:F-box domain containing protein n=2 Tax=Zea mays TaxID=4577 RepID=A0A1D6IEH8_MAIZE|nr:F-box domain containing protein [Zea mays]ONM58121.1 F-box domain containing protein [Zea mays]PWZ15860.1 hypothetical protein Zm00014a_021069 [Zea mays]|eukprot:NP_001151411.2 F-box domain containing protein [Zea mays]
MTSRNHRTLPGLEATEPERPAAALSIDLMEEIFLRVASPADLARASTACVSFRRIISDPSFLRRYRSIHPPLLLGLIGVAGFTPADPPHPSAALSRAVARAADISFDFLPRSRTANWRHSHPWYPCDVRDGRVLVKCIREEPVVYLDLAVCDPLSRRYLLLPPLAEDLVLASVGLQKPSVVHSGVSFIPSGGVEETSFRVISWKYSKTRLAVFVFTSSSGSWSVGTSTTRDDLGLDHEFVRLYSVQCVYGHCYWRLCGTSKLIKLDMNSMEFSTVDLPPDHEKRNVIIVESWGSNVAMFSMIDEGASVDYYTSSQNDSEKSHEWHMMISIPLPADYIIGPCFKGPAEGYIFLEGIRIDHEAGHSGLFSLEIKSFKIERVCMSPYRFFGRPYFGFPPSMSPTRI